MAKFDKLSEDDLWWLAAHLDGDGCVSVQDGRIIEISMDKAEKGIQSLDAFYEAFGGIPVHKSRDATDTSQAQFKWRIFGIPAVEVCKVIWPYTQLKKKQFKLASTFPEIGSCKAVVGWLNDEERSFESIAVCADIIGIKRYKLYQMTAASPGESFHVAGWKLRVPPKVDNAPIIAIRKSIDQNLRRLKHVKHDVIRKELPPSYFAGFLDAEASFGLRGSNGIVIEVPQNWPAALNALQKRYGGTVSKRQADYRWGLYNISLARNCLQDILPFLKEKHEQAKLILAVDDDAQEIKHQLRELKGNGGTYHETLGLGASCFRHYKI